MLRYAKYGYFPCKETKMKIINALRDLTDEQVELSENTGVPIINEYHKVKLFGGNYKKAFMELVDIILTDNEE